MTEAALAVIAVFVAMIQYEQRRIWKRIEECEQDRLRLHADIRRLLRISGDQGNGTEKKQDR